MFMLWLHRFHVLKVATAKFRNKISQIGPTFSKLVRTILSPPGGLGWCAPWHDILRGWNARVLEVHRTSWRSNRVLDWNNIRNEVRYIANLRNRRWLKVPLWRGRQDEGQVSENQKTHWIRECKCTGEGHVWENGRNSNGDRCLADTDTYCFFFSFLTPKC